MGQKSRFCVADINHIILRERVSRSVCSGLYSGSLLRTRRLVQVAVLSVAAACWLVRRAVPL